jgi:hypothetical protein
MNIDVANDFSPVPAGRFRADGPDSGERFREEFLKPAIDSQEDISVKIDDTAGYGSSFLEEAFGGAVRLGYITSEDFKRRLHINYTDKEFEIYKDLIFSFIEGI